MNRPPDELRNRVMQQAAGAMSLQIAFVGVANALFTRLAERGVATAETLATAAACDAGYVERWCDAAFAFGYLDEDPDGFRLTELGSAFRPEAESTLMPFAVNSVLFGHLAERAAGLLPGGEQPGESVLGERATIAPWFGSMLEAMFGELFEDQLLPRLPVFERASDAGGVVVDLGCGNGWYLRRVLRRYPNLTGVGIDGMSANIDQAVRAAEREGLTHRVTFRKADIGDFEIGHPVQIFALNRALHHVWDQRQSLFVRLRDRLAPGGALVIWEPRWPDVRSELRQPGRAGMAAQNLSEHVQGNRFLRPAEVESELKRVGFRPEIHLFRDGAEMVVVASR